MARFEASAKTGKVRRFKEFLDGAATGTASSASSPRRGRRPRGRQPLHRHQPCRCEGQGALCGSLLPRRGREPHQIVEDASCRRPHLLHKSDGQPVPAFPACRRLLAHVGLAACDAETLEFRRRAIDTLRLRLIKIAARVVEIKDPNPPASADILFLRIVLDRIPRLLT